MVKARLTKRLSGTLQTGSKSIDIKARKRIEELYEITDEIINGYNEINEKYVHHIYEKYQRLKERHRKLLDQLEKHHCHGCRCSTRRHDDQQSDSSLSAEEPTRTSSLPSSTTNSTSRRTNRTHPFIIPDVEETQHFNETDKRFDHLSELNGERVTTVKKPLRTKSPKKRLINSDEEEDEEIDEASDSNELPRALKLIIERKATKNDNAKGYLLEIPNYPSLCQFLREKSRTTFDQRPNEELLRPFIINQLGPNAAKDSKVRMRIRDEFREIHRSYLRTFMHDPHGIHKTNKNRSQPLLPTKKSP